MWKGEGSLVIGDVANLFPRYYICLQYIRILFFLTFSFITLFLILWIYITIMGAPGNLIVGMVCDSNSSIYFFLISLWGANFDSFAYMELFTIFYFRCMKVRSICVRFAADSSNQRSYWKLTWLHIVVRIKQLQFSIVCVTSAPKCVRPYTITWLPIVLRNYITPQNINENIFVKVMCTYSKKICKP